MLSRPLALWIFGPVAAGKSGLIARLPLGRFKVAQADAELERRAAAANLHLCVAEHGEAERLLFQSLRREVTAELWAQVPRWRERRENIVFETTGDKPDLFQAQIEAGRAAGYRTLGCGLRPSLEQCLARNRGRRRVLPAEVVSASWHAFERHHSEGTYGRLFARDALIVSADAGSLAAGAIAWLDRPS